MYSVFVSSSSGEAVGSTVSLTAISSGVVWISESISGVGRGVDEELCAIGKSTSTVDVSSRSSSFKSLLSGCLPLSIGDSEGVEGPAVELADDEVAGESLCRRIELRHERFKSVGVEVVLPTRLRILLGLTKLRILLRMDEDLGDPG